MIQRSLRDDRLNRQKYRFHYIHLLPKLNKHSESIAEAIHVPYRPQQISKGHNSHNKMCLWNTNAPGGNSLKMAIFRNKVITVDVIWKGFISRVCMPNMTSLSVMAQKLWPRLKFFATDRQTDRVTDRQTDRPKTRCPRISFRGHKHQLTRNKVEVDL